MHAYIQAFSLALRGQENVPWRTFFISDWIFLRSSACRRSSAASSMRSSSPLISSYLHMLVGTKQGHCALQPTPH